MIEFSELSDLNKIEQLNNGEKLLLYSYIAYILNVVF